MKSFCSTVAALLFSLLPLLANNDERKWTFTDESTWTAELVSYDEAKKEAVLRDDSGKEATLPLDKFTMVDQAWLLEWSFVSKELQAKIEQSGGRFEHLVVSKEFQTDFYIYHPSGVAKEEERPLILLFSPTAKAYRMLGSYVDSAEKTKSVIVACGEFRNTADDGELEAAFLRRFTETLPELERQIAHDPKKLIMGGTSGGAWRSYHYSALVPRPWLGILASGGWLGGPKYFDLPYPAHMRVAMLNGNQDRNANAWVERDSKILTACGSEVSLMAFEGGHQTAPSAHQTEAINWILSK